MTTLVFANSAIAPVRGRLVVPGRVSVDDEDGVLGGEGAGEVDAAEFAAGQARPGDAPSDVGLSHRLVQACTTQSRALAAQPGCLQ